MKKISLIIGCLFSGFLLAQNLVPNPSFETMTSVPSSYGQITRATPWYSGYGSCDLFHTSLSSGPAIPVNYFGTQNARTGNAYAGIAFSASNSYHEYIGVPLTSAMVPNTAYYCEAYVSAGEGGYRYGTNNFGFKFSVGALSGSGGDPPISGPSVNWPAVIVDYTNWVQISWTYTPTIAYTHLMIGNFFSVAATTWTIIPSSGSTSSMYWFIEDVVVQPATIFAETAQAITANTIGTEKVSIDWEIPVDADMSEFGLLRSQDDGQSWQKIASVPASEHALNYFYVDQPRVWEQELQYRLRTVTKNGSVNYSETASVTLDYPNLDATLMISPNPIRKGSNANVSFSMQDDGAANWEVFNLNGVQVATGSETTKAGEVQFELPSKELARGNYFFKLSTSTEAVVRRFVVSN